MTPEQVMEFIRTEVGISKDLGKLLKYLRKDIKEKIDSSGDPSEANRKISRYLGKIIKELE